jgi:two-component system, NtrC family, sensor kinase
VSPRRSLRAQGVAATLALVAYVLGSLTFVTLERGRLDADIQALQRVSAHDKALSLAEEAVATAIIDVSEVAQAGQADAAHVAM